MFLRETEAKVYTEGRLIKAALHWANTGEIEPELGKVQKGVDGGHDSLELISRIELKNHNARVKKEKSKAQPLQSTQKVFEAPKVVGVIRRGFARAGLVFTAGIHR